jgi:CDP-4-dehydro-6-deoxyglucose reductase, E1
MINKKQEILNSIRDYVKQSQKEKTWKEGEDWVQYSGPYFDDEEFVAGVESLLNGWFILGEKGREFEKEVRTVS